MADPSNPTDPAGNGADGNQNDVIPQPPAEAGIGESLDPKNVAETPQVPVTGTEEKSSANPNAYAAMPTGYVGGDESDPSQQNAYYQGYPAYPYPQYGYRAPAPGAQPDAMGAGAPAYGYGAPGQQPYGQQYPVGTDPAAAQGYGQAPPQSEPQPQPQPQGYAAPPAEAYYVDVPQEAYTYPETGAGYEKENPYAEPSTNYAKGNGGADPSYDPDLEAANEEVGTMLGSQARNQFLRKVYAIVTLQIMVTAGIAVMCMYVEPLRQYFVTNFWLWIVFLVGSFISLFVLQWKRHQHPLNLFLLGVFTLIESFFVGGICASYFENGYGSAVGFAFVTTCAIFVTITVYCWVSKRDFSFLIGFIAAGFIALAIAFLVVFIIDVATFGGLSRWVWFAISVAGSLLITAILLFQTSQIMNKYPLSEYIQATISLYVDFVNLFLCLLGAFGSAG